MKMLNQHIIESLLDDEKNIVNNDLLDIKNILSSIVKLRGTENNLNWFNSAFINLYNKLEDLKADKEIKSVKQIPGERSDNMYIWLAWAEPNTSWTADFDKEVPYAIAIFYHYRKFNAWFNPILPSHEIYVKVEKDYWEHDSSQHNKPLGKQYMYMIDKKNPMINDILNFVNSKVESGEIITESLLDNEENIINKNYIYKAKNKWELRSLINREINRNTDAKCINLNIIDVSDVIDMSCLFMGNYYTEDPANYNFDVSEWDVSNVINMDGLFEELWHFNCDISKWDVSKVETMRYMFDGCDEFNQDLSEWKVRKDADMYCMFRKCISLKEIPQWHHEFSFESLLDNEDNIINNSQIIIPNDKKLNNIASKNMSQLIWYSNKYLMFEYYGKHDTGYIHQGYTLNPFQVITMKHKNAIVLKFNKNEYLLSDNKTAYRMLRDNKMSSKEIQDIADNIKLDFINIFDSIKDTEITKLYIIDEDNNFYQAIAIRDRLNLAEHTLKDILPDNRRYLYIDIEQVK